VRKKDGESGGLFYPAAWDRQNSQKRKKVKWAARGRNVTFSLSSRMRLNKEKNTLSSVRIKDERRMGSLHQGKIRRKRRKKVAIITKKRGRARGEFQSCEESTQEGR